jgi:glycosyltransferase involved in cell wall biosynthesis
MKVYIDAASDIYYSSFYIKGLKQLFPGKVYYSSNYFKDFSHNNHFFCFVIEDKNEVLKYVVDFSDSYKIIDSAYDWCDVYGKINLIETEKRNKVIPIGPGFGIKLYTFAQLLLVSSINFIKSYSRIPNKRKFFSDYKNQYCRLRLEEYKTEKSSNKYVFFAASIWKKEVNTNNFRKNFIEACKANKTVDFNGGFAPRRQKDVLDFQLHEMEEMIKLENYIQNIKKSSFVFNTPAVLDCHGWKLAEYLALGKAIISTPISRVLPFNLKDNEDVLICNGSIESISDKIDLINSDSKFKERLERNAVKYFEEYLHPVQVIKKMIDKANIKL